MAASDTLFRLTCSALGGATLLTGGWLAASMWKGYRDASEWEVRGGGVCERASGLPVPSLPEPRTRRHARRRVERVGQAGGWARAASSFSGVARGERACIFLLPRPPR